MSNVHPQRSILTTLALCSLPVLKLFEIKYEANADYLSNRAPLRSFLQQHGDMLEFIAASVNLVCDFLSTCSGMTAYEFTDRYLIVCPGGCPPWPIFCSRGVCAGFHQFIIRSKYLFIPGVTARQS